MKVLLVISSLLFCYVAVTSVHGEEEDHSKCTKSKVCINSIQTRYDKYRTDHLNGEVEAEGCESRIFGSDEECVTENLKYCPKETENTLRARWNNMNDDIKSCDFGTRITFSFSLLLLALFVNAAEIF
ncbi:uncharacterized protein LOC115224795 isoform X1 [Octopus sinensis]|uniref:Uncharacterized protein LOC115224795 isoform X1 n=1 Tax=Octopus sinensis TaxID=2607531 RepID=A0A6P7TRP1_9MOLL|nr:uncharacterized protein LOC115224795 isoform X1 [Octopus sinensis]